MRKIKRASAFKRDFKRELKGPYRSVLDTDLRQVITALASGQPLDSKYRDHPLSQNWKGYRDCHLRPDLVLIYRLDEGLLTLTRLGSHAELDL